MILYLDIEEYPIFKKVESYYKQLVRSMYIPTDLLKDNKMKEDYFTLTIRLIASNNLGFRIDSWGGHRWINIDTEADLFPLELIGKNIINKDKVYKEYGSYIEVLDTIDNWLSKVNINLLEHGKLLLGIENNSEDYVELLFSRSGKGI